MLQLELESGLSWATEVELLMPGFSQGRLTVPRADTAIAVNGRLEEPVWIQEFPNVAFDGAEATSGEAPLRARWSDNALILGFVSQTSAPGARLRIALESGIKDPSGLSQQFQVVINEDGIVESRARAGEREVPWRCDWEVASSAEGGPWQTELRIPLADFRPLAKPQANQRWRLNAVLEGGESDQALARWGFEKLDDVKHGLILVFQEVQP